MVWAKANRVAARRWRHVPERRRSHCGDGARLKCRSGSSARAAGGGRGSPNPDVGWGAPGLLFFFFRMKLLQACSLHAARGPCVASMLLSRASLALIPTSNNLTALHWAGPSKASAWPWTSSPTTRRSFSWARCARGTEALPHTLTTPTRRPHHQRTSTEAQAVVWEPVPGGVFSPPGRRCTGMPTLTPLGPHTARLGCLMSQPSFLAS